MARVKTQKTHIYAAVNKEVVRFSCYSGFGFGQDSFGKIDATCMDSDTKDYERGLRDPGEGSIAIQLDDGNASHLKLIQLADSGEKVEWYVGSSHAETPPDYDTATDTIDLPGDRIWWTFEGYLNPVAPDDLAQDSLVTYSFTLVRTSGVTTIFRDPAPVTP